VVVAAAGGGRASAAGLSGSGAVLGSVLGRVWTRRVRLCGNPSSSGSLSVKLACPGSVAAVSRREFCLDFGSVFFEMFVVESWMGLGTGADVC